MLSSHSIIALLIGLVLGALFLVMWRRLRHAMESSFSVQEEQEQHYQALFEKIRKGVALFRLIPVAPDTSPFTLIDINQTCSSLLGSPRQELIAQDGAGFLRNIISEHFTQILRKHDAGESFAFEAQIPEQNRFLSFTVFPLNKQLFAVFTEDITARKKSDEQIQKLAYFDSLTGLPNRLLLLDRLKQALARAIRENGKVVVIFLDLDHFKAVNDTLGHDSGDLLLTQVSQRLQSCIRSSDTLARLGGDEFIALISSIAGKELNGAYIAQGFTEALSAPYLIHGRELFATASIGIAVFPEDGQDADTLLRNADMAMYAAKKGGRNGFHFYSREMNLRAHERIELETTLRNSIQQGQFLLEYQPVVDSVHETIVAAEVLVRWEHPQRGQLMPDSFMATAEESGLIVPLGEWVLRTTCRQLRAWIDAGHTPVRTSINVSMRQFSHSSFIDCLHDILRETGVESRYLEIELTESCLEKNTENNINALFRLRDMGISIVIDDFGTGYSPLGYIKSLPIDRIKIDRSLVANIGINSNDTAIVKAITTMSDILAMEVIAEGVETESQLAYLRNLGCHFVQGYYYHRPLSTEAFTQLLV